MRTSARYGSALALLAVACGSEPAPTPASSSTSTSSASSSGTPASSSGDVDSSESSGGDPLPCNGAPQLCTRPYDTVVFPGTHNTHAATEAGFTPLAANQTHPLATQLDDGIRVLLLDVVADGDALALCHGPCDLGSIPHLDALSEIDAFVASNPREVVTIIYQDDAEQADVVADLEAAGLVDRMYAHGGGAWPTLGELIDAGTTLVVTAERGGSPPAWYHHVWDEAWDTGYQWTSIAEFDCEPNRGSPDHALFLLNHWVSTAVGLSNESAAEQANALDTLLARVEACPRLPTFIAVDFYDQGDLFEAVASLNGLP